MRLRSNILRRAISTGVASALTLCAAPAFAHALASEMIEGDATDAPVGYVDLCRRDAHLCQQLAGAPSRPTPDGAPLDARNRMAMLKQVNHYVNANVTQRADNGSRDRWDRSGTGRDAVGDCEDLAIEKRVRLIEAGFPADNLYFAVGYQHAAGLHLVLVARTERGDYVLDSRTPYLNLWVNAPYVWIMRQATGQSNVWRSALPASSSGPARGRTVAATDNPSPTIRS